MPFNPNNPKQLGRLGGAVRWSRLRMEPFRRNNFYLQQQVLGAHYSWSANPKPVHVNLLGLAYNIYLRQLVSKACRSMSTPSDPSMKPVAADFDAWMDRAAVGMRLLESLRTCAANALSCLGVMKVGVHKLGDLDIDGSGNLVPVGQPFALPVSLDNFVCDMSATRLEYWKYAGDLIEIPLDEAKEDKSFDKEAREALAAAPARIYGEFGEPLTSTLSQGTNNTYGDDYEDVCLVWNLWLPREKLVVTVPYEMSSVGGSFGGKPLRVVEWDEPREGPYRVLSLGEVPDNVMPIGPLQYLVDMHLLLNQVWRKLARQARRQKKVNAFRGQAKEDAKALNEADDGEAVPVQHPDMVQEVMMGGMPPEMVLFAEQVRNITSWLGGNLDTMGGLSPQAQTLGQEELLSKSSSAQVAEMQDRVVRFTREVMGDLARHWWDNPVLHYTAARPGVGGLDVPVSITPQMRQQPFDRLRWDIDPYSMQNETPATRLAGVLQIFQQVLLPMNPMLQSQGKVIKLDDVLEAIGRYGNFPDLQSFIGPAPPPPEQQTGQALSQGLEAQNRMPAQTQRTQKRINVPGQSDRSQTQMLAQMMAGARGPNGQNNGSGR